MNKKIKTDIWYIVICLAVVLASFAMTLKQMGEMYADFAVHARFAGAGRVDPQYIKFNFYPLWHLGVQLWANKLHVSLNYAAAVVSAGFAFLTVSVTYCLVKSALKNQCSNWGIAALTLGLSFVAAIRIPFMDARNFIDYIGPTIWHNPTNLAVKPFAIAAVFLFFWLYERYGTDGFHDSKKGELRWMMCLSVILLISCFTKPSFSQGFLPAVMLFLLIELIVTKGKCFVFCLKSALIFTPAALYMLYQFFSVFSPEQERNMQIDVMEILSRWSPHPWFSIVVAIAFPLFVIIVLRKYIFKDKLLWLSIVFYLTALLEAMLLIEVNEPNSGNFCWAWQLAMGVLFIVTAIRFFQKYSWRACGSDRKMKCIFWTGSILLVCHTLSGVYYYGRLLFTSAWYM